MRRHITAFAALSLFLAPLVGCGNDVEQAQIVEIVDVAVDAASCSAVVTLDVFHGACETVLEPVVEPSRDGVEVLVEVEVEDDLCTMNLLLTSIEVDLGRLGAGRHEIFAPSVEQRDSYVVTMPDGCP